MIIACIGTRDLTPEQAEALANKGVDLSGQYEEGSDNLLISGNAPGADQSWVSKVFTDYYKLYLPWRSYEADQIDENVNFCVVEDQDLVNTQPLWDEYAQMPGNAKAPWEKLKHGTKYLQARNFLMIRDCDIVYAAPGWKWINDLQTPTGGTSFGICLAQKMNKPHNLLQWDDSLNDYVVCKYNGLGQMLGAEMIKTGRVL